MLMKNSRRLWQLDCFASFLFVEATILLVSANISLVLNKTIAASGTENVAKTVPFLFFAESKPWAKKLIVVTTRVGPTNVSSHAFVFAHTPGAEFGTTTTDRRWSSPLVHLYHPQGTRVNSLPEALHGIDDDEDIMHQMEQSGGLDAPGQIAAVCKYASDHGYTIRAVGTGSSWSRLTHTKDILVVMTDLNRILTKPGSYNANEECVDIEVEAGKLVVDFVEELDKKHDRALNMMGNYAGQTVGGVANTSTHGSGIFSGTLSTLVVGLHLIISGGIQVKVRGGNETIQACKEKVDNAKYGDDPIEINSDDVLKACAVGLGSMGIIYSITYRCVPVYNLEEIRTLYQQTWTSIEDFEVPQTFAEMYRNQEDGEYFSFFVNPYPIGQGINKQIHMAYLKAKRTDSSPTCSACCSCCCNCCGGRGIADIGCMQTDCTASCLQGCANCCPTCIPRLTNFGLSQFSLKKPYVQKWYNVLQFTKGNIHVATAEWCLPLKDLNSALGTVIQVAQDYAVKHKQYSLLPVYVRLVKTDDLFLSPASKFRPDGSSTSKNNCYIEVPFLPGAFGTEEFQEVVENKLFEKFKARPHWGKNNRLNEMKIRALYDEEKLLKWKDVYRIFNKGGHFDNQFTNKMGFNLFPHIDEQPTA